MDTRRVKEAYDILLKLHQQGFNKPLTGSKRVPAVESKASLKAPESFHPMMKAKVGGGTEKDSELLANTLLGLIKSKVFKNSN